VAPCARARANRRATAAPVNRGAGEPRKYEHSPNGDDTSSAQPLVGDRVEVEQCVSAVDVEDAALAVVRQRDHRRASPLRGMARQGRRPDTLRDKCGAQLVAGQVGPDVPGDIDTNAESPQRRRHVASVPAERGVDAVDTAQATRRRERGDGTAEYIELNVAEAEHIPHHIPRHTIHAAVPPPHPR